MAARSSIRVSYLGCLLLLSQAQVEWLGLEMAVGDKVLTWDTRR